MVPHRRRALVDGRGTWTVGLADDPARHQAGAGAPVDDVRAVGHRVRDQHLRHARLARRHDGARGRPHARHRRSGARQAIARRRLPRHARARGSRRAEHQRDHLEPRHRLAGRERQARRRVRAQDEAHTLRRGAGAREARDAGAARAGAPGLRPGRRRGRGPRQRRAHGRARADAQRGPAARARSAAPHARRRGPGLLREALRLARCHALGHDAGGAVGVDAPRGRPAAHLQGRAGDRSGALRHRPGALRREGHERRARAQARGQPRHRRARRRRADAHAGLPPGARPRLRHGRPVARDACERRPRPRRAYPRGDARERRLGHPLHGLGGHRPR